MSDHGFQFDTSGTVQAPYQSDQGAPCGIWWSDLSPGVQGCIAAVLEEVRRSLEQDRRHPLPIGLVPRFSDLHPDALARIIALIDASERTHAAPISYDLGGSLWRALNATIALDGEGKVIVTEATQ